MNEARIRGAGRWRYRNIGRRAERALAKRTVRVIAAARFDFTLGRVVGSGTVERNTPRQYVLSKTARKLLREQQRQAR